MVTHGTKRNIKGREEIFHSRYGWIAIKEFFDLTPINEFDADEELVYNPAESEHYRGESFKEYSKRVRDLDRYIERDDD
ncbi:MAG: hypothetical protein Q4F97_02490 [Bacteroidales bacterium]|nr:hypothetical protein [Bacteroidales bacterium]